MPKPGEGVLIAVRLSRSLYRHRRARPGDPSLHRCGTLKLGSAGLDAARRPGDDGKRGACLSPLEARRQQLAEGFRAVADFAFVGWVHLAEGDVVAERLEQRVVAEAAGAALLVDDLAVDPGLEQFAMAVGPAQRERADEAGAAVAVRRQL